jgi:hypothetical protein
MFDQVHGKSDPAESGCGQAAEREGSGPHQVGPGVVIIGDCQAAGAGGHGIFDQPFHQPVLDRGVGPGGGEIEFQDVIESVNRPKSGVIRGQGEGGGWIEDRDLGVEQAVAKAEFLPGLVIGQHHARIHLRTGGRHRGDGEYRQGSFDSPFSGEKFPEIVLHHRSGANGLGGIDHRTSTRGHNHLHLGGFRLGHAFAGVGKQGIGTNPAMLDDLNA